MKSTYKLVILLLCVLMMFSACSQNGESSLAVLEASDVSGQEDFSSQDDLMSDMSVMDTSQENSEVPSASSEAESEQSQPPQEDDEFYILYTEDEVDFSKAPKAEISLYPWGDEYTPYAYGQVIFKKDDGFYLYMYCEETNPKATVTQNGGEVYMDSCLEFFCDYRPETKRREAHYINLEMNSKGIYLANMAGRPVKWLSDENIIVRGKVYDNYWCVTAYIPLGLIKDVYGEFEIGEGSVVECNFTKCGNGTEIPHYGTWQKLRGNTPDFHQPYSFAEVEIKRK